MCAWDSTQPENTTKLRRLGDVIRPNFKAIESADSTFKPEAINLADRTPLVSPNDPTAVAASVILYSKQDGAGKPQLYSIDPDSNIIQLTAGLPTAADPGSSYLAGGIIIKWGYGNATVAGNTITFVSAFPNNCWEVILTPQGGTGRATSVDTKTVNNFVAHATNTVTVGYIAIGN